MHRSNLPFVKFKRLEITITCKTNKLLKLVGAVFCTWYEVVTTHTVYTPFGFPFICPLLLSPSAFYGSNPLLPSLWIFGDAIKCSPLCLSPVVLASRGTAAVHHVRFVCGRRWNVSTPMVGSYLKSPLRCQYGVVLLSTVACRDCVTSANEASFGCFGQSMDLL